MFRIKFRKNYQTKFLVATKKFSKFTWSELAEKLKVHERTLFDWRREKYTMSEDAFQRCLRIADKNIIISDYKVLSEFWSVKKAAKKGGLAVSRKYGSPGTPEGRKKGGLISQQRRKLHPEFYKHCNLRKKISRPLNSHDLAEFFGIILGDGGIDSNYQVVITIHRKKNQEYVDFVCILIERLFNIIPAVYRYRSKKSKNVVGVTISSVSLVDFLLSKGLKKGNKVKLQVGVPLWIKKSQEFSKNCLRGLIDTDGCIYIHNHTSHGYKHYNIGLDFTNKSIPLLNFVYETLKAFNFSPKLQGQRSVRLYKRDEVCRYSDEIGFNNSYHLKKLTKFLKQKSKK